MAEVGLDAMLHYESGSSKLLWHPELRPVISYTNLEMTPAPVRLTLPIINNVTTRFY